jgi:VCBS repeat-containing protein
VLSITGSATTATYQTILQGILYNDTSDTPTTSNRTITVVATDGALPSATQTVTLTVAPVNDAPVNTVPAAQVVNEDTALAISGISVTDVDGNLSTVQLGVTQGTVTVTLSGGATISAGANGTTTLTLSGSEVDLNATLATLSYQGTLNYNGPDTLTVTTTDTNSATDSDTVAITVAAVNDAPVVDLNAGGAGQDVTTAFTEQTPVLIAPVGTLSDVDSANLSALTVTLTARPDGDAEESLSLNAAATTAASGAGLTVTYTSASGLLQITGAATTATYQTILQGILYNNTSATPTTSNRSITVVTNDGAVNSATQTVTITVTPVNDVPTITALADQTIAEDSTTGALAFTVGDVETAVGALTVTAVSSNPALIPNGNLTLVNLGGGNWTIEAVPALNQFGGPVTITVTVDDGTTTTDETFDVTITPVNDVPTITALADQTIAEDSTTGALAFTVGDVETAVGALTVTAVSSNPALIPNGNLTLVNLGGGNWTIEAVPALNQFGGPVTITVTVDDGTTTTDETFDVTITPVNDVPGLAANTGSTVVQGGTDSITTTELQVTDVDNTPAELTYTVTVGPVNGQLELTTAPGVAINSFTQAQINAGQVIYVHNGSLTASDSFTFTVSDGAGGSIGATTFGITVTPVNSVPSLATNGGSTVVQGLTDLITSGELQVTDADNTPDQLTYTVTTAPINGRLELTTAPGVAITSFTQADINAGRLVFVHSGAGSASDSFTFTVSDGAGGTIGATTFTFTVTPFAPPPPPPPPPPGPGPVPIPVPVPLPGPPGPPPVGGVTPVLPPPVLVTVVGAIDEPVKRVAMPSRKFARVEQPDIVIEEPSVLPLEPLSLPVKKMLAVGHKLAERLTRLADDLDRAMQEREHRAHLFGRVVSFSGMALSAGFVAWILRGGSLLASFLVSMPAWRHFDPLPVLGSGKRDRKKHDRKAREEQAQETKEFRGLDRVIKSSAKPAKQQETGRVRRPKS